MTTIERHREGIGNTRRDDSEDYGGTNAGNAGGVQSEPEPWMGRSHSIGITLPPLGVLVFQPREG